MTLHDVSLTDRFDLSKRVVLLGGIQALVRMMLMQKARDEAAGLATAGYVTGYRGSPLGGVDLAMMEGEAQLAAADVKFEPGLNEDLAATALWGSQQAELRGEGRVQGVFGLWYGKGPGVDRCGDVFRHANMAGTSAFGGVVACMGDDHTGESSTVLHQSEFALVDAMMPILSPAGVQEVLDYGLLGWALSRYTGCWVGLKCVKDTIEVTEVVDGDPHRLQIVAPADFAMPEGGLNIRLDDTPVAQEARLHDHKRFAAEAFARANRIDRRVWGDAAGADRHRLVRASPGSTPATRSTCSASTPPRPSGSGSPPTRSAWSGRSTWRASASGRTTSSSSSCVEEKRKLIEVQIKEAIFDDRRGRRVTGWKNETGEVVFSVKQALDPVKIARTLGTPAGARGRRDRGAHRAGRAAARRGGARRQRRGDRGPQALVLLGLPAQHLDPAARGRARLCRHRLPLHGAVDGPRDRGLHPHGRRGRQLGRRGAVLDAAPRLPEPRRRHLQPLGSLAIRAALAAGVNITYKILYNDAVAMTGGQPNEGGLTAPQIARELQAMGVKTLVGVYDPKEDVDLAAFPPGMRMRPRDELDAVQREMESVEGVSAILYIQTCAAEKRRRRKRGHVPRPRHAGSSSTRRSARAAATAACSRTASRSCRWRRQFGRKRAIDQSSCNKDYLLPQGLLPELRHARGREGAQGRARRRSRSRTCPRRRCRAIDGTYNIVITGVGGTGVVTIGALLAMAAHLEG